MTKQNKIFLFIDGSNFYAGQYALFGPNFYLSFKNFIKEIELVLKIKFDKIFVYASYSPVPKNITKEAKKYLKNEALFYKNIRQTKNVSFFKGYRSKSSGKEKQVDVKLAIDLVDFAHKNLYDQLYLISGDADFIQALFKVRELNKKINVVCLQNKIMYQSKFYFKTHLISFNKQQQKYYMKIKIQTKTYLIEKNLKSEAIKPVAK